MKESDRSVGSKLFRQQFESKYWNRVNLSTNSSALRRSCRLLISPKTSFVLDGYNFLWRGSISNVTPQSISWDSYKIFQKFRSFIAMNRRKLILFRDIQKSKIFENYGNFEKIEIFGLLRVNSWSFILETLTNLTR